MNGQFIQGIRIEWNLIGAKSDPEKYRGVKQFAGTYVRKTCDIFL